jgi:hypothetical protein
MEIMWTLLSVIGIILVVKICSQLNPTFMTGSQPFQEWSIYLNLRIKDQTLLEMEQKQEENN